MKKKAKLLLSAFAVLAIVGTALAFKANSRFNRGTVYCNFTCPASSKVDYTPVTLGGATTAPCGLINGVLIQPYILSGVPGTCTATASGQTFNTTLLGE